MSTAKIVLLVLGAFFLVGPIVNLTMTYVVQGPMGTALGPIVTVVVLVTLVVLLVKKASAANRTHYAPAQPQRPQAQPRPQRPQRPVAQARNKKGQFSFGYQQRQSAGDGIRDFPLDAKV